ncbi:MAG: hypothetical protein NWR10_00705, partial [Crocinitomicaceae bacterium]|nr:hypothetical protein [Crocinitomicaceae bacterium]
PYPIVVINKIRVITIDFICFLVYAYFIVQTKNLPKEIRFGSIAEVLLRLTKIQIIFTNYRKANGILNKGFRGGINEKADHF